MSEEEDFFKTCFDTVAGLEVKNESQAIAKEVVLDEIENLQQENQQLKDRINKAVEYIEKESAFLNDDEYEVFNKKDLLDLLKGDKE